MKEFTAVEILNRQKNFYKCENCEKEKHVSSKILDGFEWVKKNKGGSARRFFLYDPPQVLTLVLKRYRQIGIGKFEKVNTQVKFNETLILDPFVLLPGNCNINSWKWTCFSEKKRSRRDREK